MTAGVMTAGVMTAGVMTGVMARVMTAGMMAAGMMAAGNVQTLLQATNSLHQLEYHPLIVCHRWILSVLFQVICSIHVGE
jgi:type II secretory pathway component PulK